VISERDAEPLDVEALVALVISAMDTYTDWRPVPWALPDPERHAAHWRRQFNARMLDRDARAIIAHEPGGRPLAVVGFTRAQDAAFAGPAILAAGHIWVLFVAPDRWRRGLASGLLTRAEDALRARGCRRAILSTPDGAPACAFYEARGYRRDGRRGWYAPGEFEVVGYAKAL
jgi:GNAT superfamily N-acetyltransferase